MSGEVAFREGIAYAAGATKSYQLPNKNISAIIIEHVAGSFTGGTSPALLANSILNYLKVRVAGKEIISWDGDVVDDKVPYGIQALQEWTRYNEKVAAVAEFFKLELPDAIPAGLDIEVEFKFNSLANINSDDANDDATAYSGTVNILYKEEDKIAGKAVVMGVRKFKFSYGTNTGKIIKDVSGSEMAVKYILMYLEDNGTASNTAIDKITIRDGKKVLFRGTFARLRAETQRITGIAPSGTGWALFTFETPRVLRSAEIQIEAEIGSAGTAVNLHHWTIEKAVI